MNVPFECTAKVLNVGEEETIKRPNAPTLKKRVLKVRTVDNQIFFPELRNRLIDSFEIQDIREEDTVSIKFCFQGSEKNGKQYNNVYIKSISRVINL